jgi:hypothetical protein
MSVSFLESDRVAFPLIFGSGIRPEVRRVATAARLGAALLAPASLASYERCVAGGAAGRLERSAFSGGEVQQCFGVGRECLASRGVGEGAEGKLGCVLLGADVGAGSTSAALEVAAEPAFA